MTAVPSDLGTVAARQARWGVPLAVLVAGMFMSILDVTIVNVAIPTIQNDFGTTVEDVQWVANVLHARARRGGAAERLAG